MTLSAMHLASIEFHPLAGIFPLMDGAEFDDLVADIREHGLREPVALFDGMILDGRNRYRACLAAGVDARFEVFDGHDPLSYVVSLNLKRRHLNESQRALVAARIATLPRGRPEENAATAAITQAQASELLNVSPDSIQRARQVVDRAIPELQRAVETGRTSVTAAATVAVLPEAKQTEIVARGPKEILHAAKQIRAERAARKRAERTNLLNELSSRNAPLPQRRYAVVYADPPWQYDFSPSNDRSVENHYPTMAFEDICELPVGDICTPDAMLFLWAPPAFIKTGIAVLEAWGFELATSMVWVKDKIGTGIYVRQRHEYLLLGKRGQPITPRPGSQPDSVIEAPRRTHSTKPAQVYDVIERMYPDIARIELFSREPRQGWDAWGNQAGLNLQRDEKRQPCAGLQSLYEARQAADSVVISTATNGASTG